MERIKKDDYTDTSDFQVYTPVTKIIDNADKSIMGCIELINNMPQNVQEASADGFHSLLGKNKNLNT